MGGFAGGDKYKVNNIIFKFAVDSHGLFDCEEAAMKVAGHDLKGLISYYNLEMGNMHFPLMALVDYLGYRLIALSVLPISNETIVYGSADAGKTIHNSSPEFSKIMQKAAVRLNLKTHIVGKDPSEQVLLSSAGDIEGHISNNTCYLLDFSRTFPPSTYQPEFVSFASIPLFSSFLLPFVPFLLPFSLLFFGFYSFFPHFLAILLL